MKLLPQHRDRKNVVHTAPIPVGMVGRPRVVEHAVQDDERTSRHGNLYLTPQHRLVRGKILAMMAGGYDPGGAILCSEIIERKKGICGKRP